MPQDEINKEDVLCALKNKEFTPYYQPIINSIDGKLVGVEVLARWVKSHNDIRMPGNFLPFIEHDGESMRILTLSLIEKIGYDFSHSELNIDKEFYISVNITPAILDKQESIDALLTLAKKMKGKGIRIIVELIESYDFLMTKELIDSLIYLKENGLLIALDDFGTGHSNYSFIDKFTPDYIKIDSIFTRGIGLKKKSEDIVSSMINFAETTGVSIIAEGVENIRQVNYLENKKSFFMQGFYYSKALSISDLCYLTGVTHP